ncbi:nucleotide exchange factor GrpE [Paenibacillus turpanensis]|uniref:nucleotide exchange factor GrpE n=1 Tax=Paenibacillus turpanensis TaxID=2689078 RepID=UPI001FB57C70|nr:nucleotide exchange factor GrpE [Paenibacillus turpanensis]
MRQHKIKSYMQAADQGRTYGQTDEPTQEAAQEEQVIDSMEQTNEAEAVDSSVSGEARAETVEAGTESPEQQEIKRLQQQADENYQRYLRTQADFDNFRRRTRQEKEDFAKYASQKLIEQLLPVVDNFERAVTVSKNGGDTDSLLKGIEMIFRQMEQLLDNEGVKAIESIGQPFNPEVHQAVMTVETDEHEAGTVVEELQKGYMLKDKVIRPAMVKVSG